MIFEHLPTFFTVYPYLSLSFPKGRPYKGRMPSLYGYELRHRRSAPSGKRIPARQGRELPPTPRGCSSLDSIKMRKCENGWENPPESNLWCSDSCASYRRHPQIRSQTSFSSRPARVSDLTKFCKLKTISNNSKMWPLRLSISFLCTVFLADSENDNERSEFRI